MSLIRLTCLTDTLYAPEVDGNLDPRPYTRRRRRGRMERLVEPEIAPATALFRHYLRGAIERAAADLPADRPVVALVHGFLFDPKQAVTPEPEDTDNPHGRVYHLMRRDEAQEQRHHTTSWPLGLGFGAADQSGADGLALAFGWQSQPGFASSLISHFQNFYARAYDKAALAAWALLNALEELAAALPGHPIDIFAHSLGSRVVVRAIALAAKHRPALIGRLGRVIFLGGGEYVVEAQVMYRRLQGLEAGPKPAFYNIVSRENDVLDKLGENFGPRTFGNSQVIGHNGLDLRSDEARKAVPDWIDLQIDSRTLQDWMGGRGHEISGDRPDNIWDHWYYYTFRGNMAVYRAILREREAWAIARLRDAGVPEGVSKGWSPFGD